MERKHIINEASMLCPPLPSLPPSGLDANGSGEPIFETKKKKTFISCTYIEFNFFFLLLINK